MDKVWVKPLLNDDSYKFKDLWLGSSWANSYAHGVDSVWGWTDYWWESQESRTCRQPALPIFPYKRLSILDRWRFYLCIKMENKLEIGVICFACANEHIVLLQAWDLYYHVFRRIDKQLPSLTTLDLQARNGYIRFHW